VEGVVAKRKAAKKTVKASKTEKRTKLSQTDLPLHDLESSLKIAKCLWDNFAGKEERPLQIAAALNISPASSGWRTLTGSAIAYGITDGGYNAEVIRLTELGRRLVSPLNDGDDALARKDAALRPRMLREFLERYNQAKFPKDEIAKNVLQSLGVPREKIEEAYEILQANCKFAGFLVATPTGNFVQLHGGSAQPQEAQNASNPAEQLGQNQAASLLAQLSSGGNASATSNTNKQIERVFITHGKNKKILDQIKELVRFGQFEPIVATERESVSQPVPDKVLEEMRRCQAAVIHVSSEGAVLDTEGNQHQRINENVLIEIGAAMALYHRNFILLVEDGVRLPSNLQGLYECRYAGDELTMSATMKLLKAFNGFKTSSKLETN
jgi:predicted nucleotide-binding protein